MGANTGDKTFQSGGKEVEFSGGMLYGMQQCVDSLQRRNKPGQRRWKALTPTPGGDIPLIILQP